MNKKAFSTQNIIAESQECSRMTLVESSLLSLDRQGSVRESISDSHPQTGNEKHDPSMASLLLKCEKGDTKTTRDPVMVLEFVEETLKVLMEESFFDRLVNDEEYDSDSVRSTGTVDSIIVEKRRRQRRRDSKANKANKSRHGTSSGSGQRHSPVSSAA